MYSFSIWNLIQNMLIRGPCGALGITSGHQSHYYALQLRSQTGPQTFLFGPQSKKGFVCLFIKFEFLPRFKTVVVPEECSFHKVVPQGHGEGLYHSLVCHLPRPCVHLRFRG